jgi:hypothetical protein
LRFTGIGQEGEGMNMSIEISRDGRRQVKRLPGFRQEKINAAFVKQPQLATGAWVYSLDFIVGDGKRIEIIVGIHLKAVAIVAVQTVLGGNPQKIVSAFEDAKDHTLRETVVHGKQRNRSRLLGQKAS